MPWTFYNANGQRLSSAATNISVLDIDGATDIGAAIVDADLFIIDDGAGGTNRKTAASRIKTYVAGSVNSKTISFTRTASAGAGDQAITGAGFEPTAVFAFAVESSGSYDSLSWGFGDVDEGEGAVEVRLLRGTAVANPRSSLVFLGDGTNAMDGVLKTLDADGLTITWGKTNDGIDISGKLLFLR